MSRPLTPRKLNQHLLHVTGLGLCMVNRVRRGLIGYTSPRPFTSQQIERSVEYTLGVVKGWREALVKFAGVAEPFEGRRVLEVGPGFDLGTGLVVLAHGAKSYTAVDKHRLISKTPREFYLALLDRLNDLPGSAVARRVGERLADRRFSDEFAYVHDSAFSLNGLPDGGFDLFVSQAVLEHFDDVRASFARFRDKLAAGAMMLHKVDAGAHTSFLRTTDPLNHLRYSEPVWKLLRFTGSPNRLLMSDYARIMNELDFRDVRTVPSQIMDGDYVRRTRPHLASRFRSFPEDELGVKSFSLFAAKD
ncbi:MAG: class I SAM-dependent methyltransferase [Phycisphaerae bacterium]|nr:class I SAM-dependent methyltransferase [Phycisphaerae bacterium]